MTFEGITETLVSKSLNSNRELYKDPENRERRGQTRGEMSMSIDFVFRLVQ